MLRDLSSVTTHVLSLALVSRLVACSTQVKLNVAQVAAGSTVVLVRLLAHDYSAVGLLVLLTCDKTQ